MTIDSGPDINSIPDITGLTAGNYRFELGCNICPFTGDYINMITPNNPSISLPASHPYCDFDDSDIVITGGSNSYTYIWTPGEHLIDDTARFPQIRSDAPLPLDLTVKVTDSNDCFDHGVISLFGSPAIISSDVQPISCSNATDGIITIDDTNSPLSCIWNDNTIGCRRINLAPGTYDLLVIDNCQFVTQLAINLSLPFFPDTDGDGTIDCLDECPYDSLKVIVGVCGCDNLDTDEDNDGWAICVDQCDTDPRLVDTPCQDTIVIPPIIQDDNEVGIAVNIPHDGIDVIFEVRTEANEDPINRIQVQSLPLSEVDPDGIVIQVLDLSAISWRNVLTAHKGYDILTSTAPVLLGNTTVNLTYHHYFFHRHCYVYNGPDGVEGYGVANKPIDCNSTDPLDEIWTEYESGDSKLSFMVENWPFQHTDNLLRATYRYNSLEGSIDSQQLEYRGDIVNILYIISGSYGLRLSIDFLANSVIDDSLGPVEILANDFNQVTVLFDHFERVLIYDPSLRFLLSSSDNTNTYSWILWRGPVIAAGIMLILVIIVILLIMYIPPVHQLAFGDEGIRVESLRDFTNHHKSRGISDSNGEITLDPDVKDNNPWKIEDGVDDHHEVNTKTGGADLEIGGEPIPGPLQGTQETGGGDPDMGCTDMATAGTHLEMGDGI
jgi:hypothetical protein